MSELITEIAKQQNKSQKIHKKQYLKNGITKQHFNVDGFEYCLVNNKNLSFCDDKQKWEFVKILAGVIKKMAGSVNNVLVVGLGNRHISADGLGSETIKNVIATRNLINSKTKISVISTSVMGLTGIESSDIITATLNVVNPDLVVLVDTLCASDFNTIGCNFQFSTSVLKPGHGVGNKRKSLVWLYNKAKVVSIGVPLVVYAKSFLEFAINKIKSNNNVEVLNNLLKCNFNSMVLTPKDIDLVVKTCGGLIGYAINFAFNGYSVLEQRSILQKL